MTPATEAERKERNRQRVWDVAAVLSAYLGAAFVLGEAQASRGLTDEQVFLHLVAGCVLAQALWWRHRWPVAVAVFLNLVSVVAEGAGVASLIALFTVVTLRRGRPTVLVTALSLVTGLLFTWLNPDPAVPAVVAVALTVAITAATVAIGLAARARRELIASLRERAARAEEETRLRADRLRSLERERIAREMHDALAHRISMVSLHAGALQIRPDLTPEEVAKAAATIRDSAHQALEDLREILGVLRAGDGDGDGLRPQPDLRDLGDLLADADRAGVRVSTVNHLDGLPISASLGRTLYRLIQEGLTNAGKHAPGTSVRLLLESTGEGELHLLISNPLPGIARSVVPGAGAGLVGLAERVELLHGRLSHGVRTHPGAGLSFDLEAWLPWPS
ncbi:two-component sensor histidine kinase [Actinoplanes lobatus]|uniref:histidine kinase n=1 Tax=Actinoplanes lobatus TaxID=113568 RepID=A0A7W7HQD5_9ACTN|nr:histidine kinase [Actinoplanes lobatus]MBB4754796.1 signal transduction histidine kinase [Actinoplanes lobatus]GGN81752.1 two-component sensor histidine kinase [Actinoplanes lobatus]GIE43073.1 two-component sensor histidine kinase [Actinoplanes lobatus]